MAVIKVMTYNIHSGIGTDGVSDWRRIAEVVRAEAPDLLALQEVTFNSARLPGIGLAAVLGGSLGMESCFGRAIAINQGQGDYGVAALSKYAMTPVETLCLPTPDGHEKRVFLVVKVLLPTGPCYFIVTHFSYQGEFAGDADYRLRSARSIMETAAARGYTPAIWAGDFNATPDSAAVTAIRDSWDVHNDAMPEAATALCRHAGWCQIDYICSAPQGYFRRQRIAAIDDLLASDHRPVVAELLL